MWWITSLYARAEGTPGKSSEMEGIGIVMGVVGGGAMGYWTFAWRIMNALETRATVWAVLLVAAWVIAPLVWARRWWKREKARAKLPRATINKA